MSQNTLGSFRREAKGGADGEEGSQALRGEGGEYTVSQARSKKWLSWKEKGPLPYHLSPGRQPTLGCANWKAIKKIKKGTQSRKQAGKD